MTAGKALMVVAVLAVVGAAAFFLTADEEPASTVCWAEVLSGPNGESYVRDPQRDCQFVDERGDLVVQFADGRSLCYSIDPSSAPSPLGGQAVDCNNPAPGTQARPPE